MSRSEPVFPDHELDAPPWKRFESTLMATSKSIRRAYDLRLQPVGLNLSEACLLSYVTEHAPLTQTQVADRIGMGRAPAGAIVDRLCRDELLIRMPDPSDRRVWSLEATTSGMRLADQVASIDRELRNELRNGLTRAERDHLATILLQVQRNLARVLDG